MRFKISLPIALQTAGKVHELGNTSVSSFSRHRRVPTTPITYFRTTVIFWLDAFDGPKGVWVVDIQQVMAMDEEIVQAIIQRHRAAEGPVGTGPAEKMETWARELSVSPDWLTQFFRVCDAIAPFHPIPEPPTTDNLQAIVPLIRKASWRGIDFCITHASQYPDCSLVHMVIDGTGHDPFVLFGHPVKGRLVVHATGHTFSGRIILWETEGAGYVANFRFSPRLPDALQDAKYEVFLEGTWKAAEHDLTMDQHMTLEQTNELPELSFSRLPAQKEEFPLYRDEFHTRDEEIVRLVKQRVSSATPSVSEPLWRNLAAGWYLQLGVESLWLRSYLSCMDSLAADHALSTFGPMLDSFQPSLGILENGVYFEVYLVTQYSKCSVLQIRLSRSDDHHLRWGEPPTLVLDDRYSVRNITGPSVRVKDLVYHSYIDYFYVVEPPLRSDFKSPLTLIIHQDFDCEIERIPVGYIEV